MSIVCMFATAMSKASVARLLLATVSSLSVLQILNLDALERSLNEFRRHSLRTTDL